MVPRPLRHPLENEMPVPTAPSREEPAARPVDPMTGGRRWRAARETSLAEPYGWLSVVALHWLDRAPQRLPGVPGEWSSDDSSVRVRVTAPDAAVDAEA